MKTPENDPDSQYALERLVQQAELRFLEEGPSRVSMTHIAQDLGMSKKTIYRIIPSKESLIEMIILRVASGVRKEMDAVLASESLGYDEKIDAFMAVLSRALSRFNRTVFIDLQRSFPRVAEKLEDIRRKNLQHVVTRLIQIGQESGQVQSDVDVPFFVESMLQTIRGLFLPESMARHQLHPSEIPTKVGRFYFRSIRKS